MHLKLRLVQDISCLLMAQRAESRIEFSDVQGRKLGLPSHIRLNIDYIGGEPTISAPTTKCAFPGDLPRGFSVKHSNHNSEKRNI